jgi:hypothetical protein
MCEDTVACKRVGAHGYSIFESGRICLMLLSSFLSFLIFLLICVMLGGASEEDSNVENCAWAYAEYSVEGRDYTSYIGLLRYVVAEGTMTSDTGSSKGVNWADCEGVDYCSDCKIAGDSSLKASALAFILSIPLVITSFIRISKEKDTNANKFFSIVCSSILLLLLMIAMGQFGNLCFQKLPSDLDYVYGPGFGAATASFVFEIFVLVVHICTPVNLGSAPLAEDEEDLQEDKDQA